SRPTARDPARMLRRPALHPFHVPLKGCAPVLTYRCTLRSGARRSLPAGRLGRFNGTFQPASTSRFLRRAGMVGARTRLAVVMMGVLVGSATPVAAQARRPIDLRVHTIGAPVETLAIQRPVVAAAMAVEEAAATQSDESTDKNDVALSSGNYRPLP